MSAPTTSACAGSISDKEANALRAAILITGVSATALQRDPDGIHQYGKVIFATSAATVLLKKLVDAERPNGNDNDSFPSGHVAVSVAAATYLQKRYGPRFGLPAYLASAFVAHNRLENDHHRISDIIASAALALVINQQVTTTLHISSDFSDNHISLRLTLPF